MDRVIFGDNQFFAVNHMSEEKSRQQAMRFRKDSAIINVLDGVYEMGINTFMCTTHDRIECVAGHIRDNRGRYSDFKFYPCMPYAHKYANGVAEMGMLSAAKHFAGGNMVSMAARAGYAISTRNAVELMKLLVDAEMRMFKGLDIEIIFLQNVVTDLMLGLGMGQFLSEFHHYVQKKYGAEAGFITMNLPLLRRTLKEQGVDNPVICASYNASGFRMAGDDAEYRQVLDSMPCRFIAMQVLAAGALPPEAAIRYVGQNSKVHSVLFGASSREHISQTKELIERYIRPDLNAPANENFSVEAIEPA